MSALHFLGFINKLRGYSSAVKSLGPKRLGIFALLFVFMLSFIASTGISNLIPVQTAHADVSPENPIECQFTAAGWKWNGDDKSCLVSTYTPDQEVSSLSYYASLTDCIGIRMEKPIVLSVTDNKVAPPSKWFDTGTIFPNPGDAYKTGEVYPGGDTSCADIATKALQLWGWGNDYVQFLTDIGWKYDANTTTWTQGSGGDSQRNPHFQNAVKAKVYNAFTSSLPPLTDAAQYIEDLYFFFGTKSTSTGSVECNAQDLGTYPDLGGVTGYKNLVDSRKVISVDDKSFGNPKIESATDKTYFIRYDKATLLNSAKKGVSDGYVYMYSAGTSTAALPIYIFSIQAYGTPKTETCDQILKDINNNVGAYALWLQANPSAVPKIAPDTGAAGATPASSCVIQGIGWIVCPVVNFLAQIADGSFTFLANNFLKTDPQVFNTTGPTYTAWGVMRTIANVAFVIVFLIIIFSQLTGFGASNYGIKKMLPRLVVAAILVNISYFISQLAVDISNILGFSIKDLFNGLTAKVGDAATSSTTAANPFSTGDGLTGVAGAVLASTLAIAAVYALLSTLIPVLLAAVVALVMILFILVARQAIVILLVVISPLAFVAFLLPNTEGLFKQWRKMLTSMLLLFPIIALVFGASQLASQILSGAFDGTVAGDSGTGSSPSLFGQIAAAAVLVLPLFAVPIILKKSLDGIPVLGQMASKFASRANGNLGKKVNDSYKNSLIGRGRANKTRSDQAYMDRKFANRMQKGGLASKIANGPGITGKQKYAQQTLNSAALLTVKKAQIEDIEAAGATIEGLGRPALREIARGGGAGAGNPATMAAAIKQTVASNDVEGINQLWNESKSWGDDDEGKMKRSTFAQSLRASANRPNYLGQGALSAMEQNDQSNTSAYKDIGATVADAVTAGAYSAEKIATSDPDELKIVQNIANTNTDPTFLAAHQQLINDAHTALTDPQLLRTMTKNRGIVGQMRNNESIPIGKNGSPLA